MMTKKARPLSPHLSIYKPQISSVLSIAHRVSGVVNFIGIAFMMWWIFYLAYYGQYFGETIVYQFFTSLFGKATIVLWTFSVFFHMCTGIRHLFWDCGFGFKVETMNKTGWLAVVMAVILTVAAWSIYLGQL
jgi:succinate dehydrogenase / fumarate reductase cytochrome b subunit